MWPSTPAERRHLACRCRTCCLRRFRASRPPQSYFFRGSIPHPIRSLCTLRIRRRRRVRNTRFPAVRYRLTGAGLSPAGSRQLRLTHRNRKFESTSLQRRVCLSPGAAFEDREPRLSARLCAAGLATGSAETRRVLQDRANRRQYLCRATFQYRSAADGVGENATPISITSGRSPSLIVRWISALGPGSTKAQHDPLIVPGKRQA